MKRIGALAVVAALTLGLGAAPAQARRHRPSCDSYDDEDNGRNCNDGTQGGGNGNKGRDGDEQRGDKNCHSFCGNTIIIPNPMETTTTTSDKGRQPGETPRAAEPSPACLINVPYHCDPKPR